MKFKDDYIFCTLALGEKYHLLARNLADNLLEKAPGHALLVLTDNPRAFAHCQNAIAKSFKQQGILHCYHDKRFALQHALVLASTAIMIDVDAFFLRPVPDLVWQPGIEGRTENLVAHAAKYTPERLPYLKEVAEKLDVDINTVSWLGESLFTITRDGGKEQEFLLVWSQIARYLQLRRIHSGEGHAIGIAAAKVGWQPQKTDSWSELKSFWQHFNASKEGNSRTKFQLLRRRLSYHYRMNFERIRALQDFEFYYR